ncbi:MAG: hypothetical protein K2G77_03060 [Muribaculaceae bacterium]|nr:hypothetical protein [Muribaculaceae bacterium]
MKKLIFLLLIFTFSATEAFDVSARYKGDLNGDNRVDLADMVYLAKAIQGGSTDKALDVNASGSVDENDLHKLADLIISEKLNEDSGLNVGIGEWKDSGEDFGGVVKAPAYISRSVEDTRFFIRNPKTEDYSLFSIEFGISESNITPSAVLLNIRFPWGIDFNTEGLISIDESISITHKVYGKPIVKKENPNDLWSGSLLRFIIFSNEMMALPAMGKLGCIWYSVQGYCEDTPIFVNCQVNEFGKDDCTILPEHDGGYNGDFIPREIYSISLSLTGISLSVGEEELIDAYILPLDADDKTLSWTSFDESIATVYPLDDHTAIIKAINEGVTVVKATTSNGLSDYCEVTVKSKDAVNCLMGEEYPCDIYSPTGTLIKKGINASEIENLNQGIYIIRQRGKIIKHLK